MKRGFKIAVTAFVAALLCLGGSYWLAFRYWKQRSTVLPIQPPERKITWTGDIPATDGCGFKLFNLINFCKRNAGCVVFSKKTRQLFITFGGDDSFYQWDVDMGKCVYTFPAEKGFAQWVDAVSPDGKYLVVTRNESNGPNRKILIISVEKRSKVADLGDLGAIFECRFSPDSKRVWLRTGAHWNGPLVFKLDGAPVNTFFAEDFPENRDSRIWEVPVSKERNVKPGLYFKDTSGVTNLLTKDFFSHNYWITKDARFIVATDRDDDVVVWDAKSAKEIIRQRITNHHNIGGYLIYDEAKDRFLIADPSYQGTTYLREFLITNMVRNMAQ